MISSSPVDLDGVDLSLCLFGLLEFYKRVLFMPSRQPDLMLI